MGDKRENEDRSLKNKKEIRAVGREWKRMRKMNTMLTRIRVGFFVPAFLLCLVLFAGCGKDTAKNTTNATVTTEPSATETPTPTPEREPKEYALADLYETVGRDTVYRLFEAEVSDAAAKKGADPAERKSKIEILTAQTAGDYVLACLCDPERFAEDSTDEYVLFHLGRPDLTRRYNPAFRENQVRLLSDGTVVLCDAETNTAHVYNREFEEIGTVVPKEERSWYILDVSEDGLLWICISGEKRSLAAYSLQGECVGEYTYDGDYSIYSYSCLSDGVRYFRATDANYLLQPLVILPGATELTPVAGESGEGNVEGMFSCETADSIWYIHKLGDAKNELYFTKEAHRENINQCDGDRFLTLGNAGERCDKEHGVLMTAQDAPREFDYRVYDYSDRTVCGRLMAEELPQYKNLYAKSLSAKGYVLFAGQTEKGTELLLWDVNRETAEPIRGLFTIAEKPIADRLVERIAEIEAEYGIRIRYDAKSIEECVFAPWYRITPLASERKVLEYVESVAHYVKMYPKALWREMLSDDRDGLDMYLVDSLESIGVEGFSAAGCVQTYSESLAVAFARNGLNSTGMTFAHETMHLLEHRILNYAAEQGIDWDLYWSKERTSKEYPYTRGDAEPVNDGVFRGAWWYGIGERGIAPDQVWYARTYGMWNELEDRATIMEELFSNNRELFETYPHLREKAEDMCAVIRAAFPCVSASAEPLFWERVTGIVNPADRMADWSKYPADMMN